MKSNYSSQVVYREVQYFRQIWIWLTILFIAGLSWYALIIQLGLGRPFGDKPMPDSVLIVFWLIFGIGLPVAAFYSRLITEVRGDGVYFRYVPFHFSFRQIPFADMIQFEARTYRPLREFGGWGIRLNFKGGRAYTVSGNQGVQFKLTGGRQILIGSQHPQVLAQAIEKNAK